MSQSKESFADYDGFVEKFRPKRTTDDCYTPPEVYAVVLDYVRERWGVDEADVVRPFWPGGDFESFVGEGVRWHHHSPFPVSLLPPTILGDTNHVPHGLIGRMPCRNRAHLTRGCSSRGAGHPAAGNAGRTGPAMPLCPRTVPGPHDAAGHSKPYRRGTAPAPRRRRQRRPYDGNPGHGSPASSTGCSPTRADTRLTRCSPVSYGTSSSDSPSSRTGAHCTAA